ncbi:unnamed protein product [Closterium sp. NIES-65]|nr:unnamed protein product [Closterium sp. NIES-65]
MHRSPITQCSAPPQPPLLPLSPPPSLGAASSRTCADSNHIAFNLAWLASEWGDFSGSDTWLWQYADCRAMEGIRCDRDGFVIAIELGMKNLQAPIPDMISRFQRLRYL